MKYVYDVYECDISDDAGRRQQMRCVCGAVEEVHEETCVLVHSIR
jgi:hypothetical protein